MTATVLLICFTAFVAGAYTSAIPNFLGVGVCLLVGGICAVLLPKYWHDRDSPPWWVYLLAGAIGALACMYVLVRTPVLTATDIANQAPMRRAIVQGTIDTSPSRTRSDRVRFNLAVQGYKKSRRDENFNPATGTLYVTVPLLEGTGRRRGDRVEIRGSVYKPSPASNPGGFDFQQFLARQGIFAGMAGQEIEPKISPPRFGEWWITSGVVKAHVTGAGVPEGTLLSSLVLGGRAVDLPADLRDTFVKAGLAAMLAASGFHVSIILATALSAVQEGDPKLRMIVGTIALLGYAILTGASPSIIRAAIMGIGGLAGLAYGTKVRPLLGLAGAAALLLLWQPLWIYDLSFQFSFLATFGLMVSANSIEQKLEFLPPTLAGMLAIPIAAVLWTLPLQLFVFGRISVYCILANLLTTHLISACIMGGVVAGIAGVIFLPLGAGLSWLLKAPLWLTIRLAEWTNSLPGAITNTGSIDLWQLGLVYMLFVLVWAVPKVAKWWIPVGFLSVLLLFAPGALARANLFQVTVLATNQVPAVVIQNQGQTALINSGDSRDVQFSVFPYLQKSGINNLTMAIATDSAPRFSEGWQTLKQEGIAIPEIKETFAGEPPATYKLVQQTLSDTNFSTLKVGEKLEIMPSVVLQVLATEPQLWQLTTENQTWLFLGKAKPSEQDRLARSGKLPKAQILWWTGSELSPKFLQSIEPQFVIAATNNLSSEVRENLNKNLREARLLVTGRDGAIIWTPANGIETLRDAEDNSSAL